MAEPALPFTAIILAARRAGRLDPLAAEAGVTHKSLVPILGKPLIQYVLEALVAVPGLERIRISIEPEAVESLRAIHGASGELGVPVEFVGSRETIADSAYSAAEGLKGPILVTTADNVNLTPETVLRVMAPLARTADGVIAVAERRDVLSARGQAPDTPGTERVGPYRFRDGAFSNCNLYAMAGPHVLRGAEVFREGGQFSKKKRRLVKLAGPFNLALFTLRLLTLDQAMRRLSRRLGFRLAAVQLQDGAQAVDVDNPGAYRAAERIIRNRSLQPAPC